MMKIFSELEISQNEEETKYNFRMETRRYV